MIQFLKEILKGVYLYFDIVIVAVEIAKIGKWKKKRSCARALIQTSTWKSKIGTFYLCCKIIQDEIHFEGKVIADIDENTGYSIYW